MRTVAVIARKGGSGKTTVAAHLAIAAHLRGLRALVADIDPQRSAIEALRARSGPGPEWTDSTGPKLFALQMAAVRDGMDALIIDTPAGAVEDVANAVVLADLCLMVLRPTFLDIAAAIHTVETIRRLRKPGIIVVNQAPPPRGGVEPPAVKRALKALAVMRMPVVPTILRSRTVYQTALEQGRSAEEADDAAAAQEIAGLWSFLERLVFTERNPVRRDRQALETCPAGA